MILRLSKLAARLAATAMALLYPALASAQTGDTAVSGALDRLHQENDPCVRYDLERKVWIYLHGSRTEEELNQPPRGHLAPPVLARPQ